MKKIKSDGGSSKYYFVPKWVRDINDLIHHKKMNFNVANIFKACYRYGEKDGIDREYDLNKIIFFAQRELEYIRMEKNGYERLDSEELSDQDRESK